MPRTPLPPSEPGRPGRRRPLPGTGRPPLPDPSAVRLCAVPGTAPPYDDELLAGPGGAGAHPGGAAAGGSGGPGGAVRSGDPGTGGCGAGLAAADDGRGPGTGAGPEPGVLPGRFAQVLVETLAGARPPRQMATWTTERARNRIQRLGPVLTAGQRPRLRRVVAFRPRPDVIEMTLVLSCGPRIRALAVRLEHLAPPAGAAPPAPGGGWCCTDVEVA